VWECEGGEYLFNVKEHVGRQRTFPYGIDIVSTVDYFAVGNLRNCYTKLTVFLAQYEPYKECVCVYVLG
jgi:hypothetical protein